MNVLMVNPSQFTVYGRMTPPVQIHMGLAYLGAVLKKKGHSVSVIDMDAERVTEKEFASKIKEEPVDILGITVTTPTLSSALRLADMAKSASRGIKVVFGGIHPSVMPGQVMSYENVDFVVKGEGERTFAELLDALGNNRSPAGVNGILFKDRGEIKENADRGLIEDLDTLPFPERGLFKNRAYTYPDSLYAACAPMITSRGCPGRCTYCNASSVFGRRFRARSAENVADEIAQLVRDHRIREIHIWDDNFVTHKDRVFKLRDIIQGRRLKVKFAFPNGIRADFLDDGMLKALKDMGTYSIALGIESGSQQVLDAAKKGIRLNKVIEVVLQAKRLKLEVWGFFMFGLPGEDMKAARDTIDLAKSLDLDVAKFHILKPYPGTEAYGLMQRDGLLDTLDYDSFGIHTPPVHHLNSLSAGDMLILQRTAYREFYLRPRKILEQMLRIKTYNRFKLNMKAASDVARQFFK